MALPNAATDVGHSLNAAVIRSTTAQQVLGTRTRQQRRDTAAMLDCQVEKAAAAEDKAARPRRQRVKFMSIRQHLEVQRVQNQEKQDPDNWFVRKVRGIQPPGRTLDRVPSLTAYLVLVLPVHRRNRRRSVRVQLLRLRRSTMHSHDPHGRRSAGRTGSRACVPNCSTSSGWQ